MSVRHLFVCSNCIHVTIDPRLTTEIMCDGCGNTWPSQSFTGPMGMVVIVIPGHGERQWSWHACSARCVSPAMVTATSRAAADADWLAAAYKDGLVSRVVLRSADVRENIEKLAKAPWTHVRREP